jgi:hypothetical protein
MDYVEAGLLILLVAAGSIIVADLFRRALGFDLRRRQHEVGNQLYPQIGVLFAVLLAFMFNEVLGQYNAAAQAINGECAALHGAAMLANDLSDGEGKAVEKWLDSGKTECDCARHTVQRENQQTRGPLMPSGERVDKRHTWSRVLQVRISQAV